MNNRMIAALLLALAIPVAGFAGGSAKTHSKAKVVAQAPTAKPAKSDAKQAKKAKASKTVDPKSSANKQ